MCVCLGSKAYKAGMMRSWRTMLTMISLPERRRMSATSKTIPNVTEGRRTTGSSQAENRVGSTPS